MKLDDPKVDDRNIDDRKQNISGFNSISEGSLVSQTTLKSMRSIAKSIDPNMNTGRWLEQSRVLKQEAEYGLCSLSKVKDLIAVKKSMPNMKEVCVHIAKEIERSQIQAWAKKKDPNSVPFFLNRALLLVGPAGCGKSYFGIKVAEIMGVPYKRIDFGSGASPISITGSERAYVSGQSGEIINAITEGELPFGNPLVIIDEIEKVNSGSGKDPSLALGQLLEMETAKQFVDNYLSYPVDCSSVSFILTANSLNGIPSHILDRVKVLHIPAPSENDIDDIILPEVLKKGLCSVGLDLICDDELEFNSLKCKAKKKWKKHSEKNKNKSVRQLGLIVDDVLHELFTEIIRNQDKYNKYRRVGI